MSEKTPNWTAKVPSEIGWYWCWNRVDDTPSGEWQAPVRVEKDLNTGKLFVSWFADPWTVMTLGMDEIGPDARWIKIEEPDAPSFDPSLTSPSAT